MATTPPPNLIARVRQILQPFVTTVEAREALLTEAFYLYDPKIYYGIDRQGDPRIFSVNCVQRLLVYGCPAEGEHSLSRLLLTVRGDCGVDKHAEIDDLVSIANDLCRSATPAKQPDAAPISSTAAPLQTTATPSDERRPSVFISYSRTDKDFAERLIGDLRSAGHACWIDTTDIKGGDDWIQTIAEGINNSYAFVIVATIRALQSQWVRDEIVWARKKNKPIIPVLLENVVDEVTFFPLARYEGIALFQTDYQSALRKLLGSLPHPALPEMTAIEPATKESPVAFTGKPILLGEQFNVPRKVELDYLERLRVEELVNTEKYTPLAGTHQRSLRRPEMRAVFELLSMGKQRQEQQRSEPFDNVIEKILSLRRVVLLGEPGGGKTTTIWKLAAEMVEKALVDRSEPIPLLVRLGRWTEADQPLPDFIASQLGDLGKHLDALLAEKRAALMLDGLNELPTGQRGEKYPQVQHYIEQHRDLLSVLSCRELDYTIDLGFDRINILPLDPIRIREFVKHYLPEQGDDLFWNLAGPQAKDTYQEFLGAVNKKLPEPDHYFWLESQPPIKTVKGIWGWSKDSDWNWQEWLKHRESPSSLMVLARNPYMLLMLTSVYDEQGDVPENRGELFRLFVETLLKREKVPEPEQQPLSQGLAKVAYEMQIRRANDDDGNAQTVLPRNEVKAILGERLLYLAASASILSAGDQVRFTHQLLQEYFAAHYMDLKIKAGDLKAADLWKPDQWWERNNWEEAAKLLAGLYSNDCTPVVEWIAQANPEVAAQCVKLSGAGLAEATRERLRAQWLPRLTDLAGDPDPKARAAIGRALGLTDWDNRKGVGLGPDGLPDFDWVEIPGGDFQYGKSNPPQILTLPMFYIARYPVTYIQFQAFLDDPQGYADLKWFEGLAADDSDRRMDEQWFKFANHPREMVNWYQAMAFCRWLSWRMGGAWDLKKIDQWAVRLPTEFEWEKAARGTDGRIYPYEGDFNPAKANTYETGIGQTTAVGIFPNGASPYGVMDMSGNVWEWCLSRYDNPAKEARKENLVTGDTRILRGGSWSYLPDDARAVSRDDYLPDDRRRGAGFRVVSVMRPPSQRH